MLNAWAHQNSKNGHTFESVHVFANGRLDLLVTSEELGLFLFELFLCQEVVLSVIE